MSFCDGVLIVIGGMPVDVKGACDQLRAAAGGEHIEESHIQLCLPGKVCNIYCKGQRLTYIRSQAGSFLYKVVDVVVISKNPLTFSVWKFFWYIVKCPPYLSQLPRTITLSKDSELRHILPLDAVGWLIGEHLSRKKVRSPPVYLNGIKG